MSREHRAPLVAFVLVTLICFTFLVTAVRSEALRGFVQRTVASAAGPSRAVLVTSDVTSDLTESWAGVVAESRDADLAASVEVARVRPVALGRPALRPRPERDRLGHTRHGGSHGRGVAHDGRDHPGKAKGHDKGDRPGKAKGHDKGDRPGKAEGHDKGDRPGKAEGHDKGDRPGKAEGHDKGDRPGKAKGHDKGDHPGKAKGHRS